MLLAASCGALARVSIPQLSRGLYTCHPSARLRNARPGFLLRPVLGLRAPGAGADGINISSSHRLSIDPRRGYDDQR